MSDFENKDNKKRKNSKEDITNSKKIKKEDNLKPEIKDQILKLNNEKNQFYKKIYSNINENNVLRNKIRLINKELNKVCPHKWVRDWDQYEPCGRTPKICEYCGL